MQKYAHLVVFKVELLSTISLPGYLTQLTCVQVTHQQGGVCAANQETVLVEVDLCNVVAIHCAQNQGYTVYLRVKGKWQFNGTMTVDK